MRLARRLLIVLTPLALLAAGVLHAVAPAPRVHAQTAPQPPTNAVEVTANASGQAIYIGVGQPLLVRLNPDNVWNVAVDETMLQPLALPNGLPDGVQAAFTALAPGTTTLTATGTAHCAPRQPCPQFAVQFTATIQIVPASTTVIGPDANGGTVSIAQGDTLIVQLGAGFLRTFTFTPNDVLVPAESNIDLGPGVQSALLALQTGSVDVEATGVPDCQLNQACPAIAAVFSTTIVVQ